MSVGVGPADVSVVSPQLATWDSLHGLNGSLKESRIENGMQGVTIKVVTLLVGKHELKPPTTRIKSNKCSVLFDRMRRDTLEQQLKTAGIL